MIAVQSEFQDRVQEIEAFFGFIHSVDSNQTVLMTQEGAPAYSTSDREDLLRTFKASAFLLLYNLMESTVCNSIEAIFDELKVKGTSFDEYDDKVKKIIIDNLKLHSSHAIVPELREIAVDIAAKTFKKREIVSGNVDASAIRKVADRYGFSRPAADGSSLLTIKSHRNDLAHGAKSFAEVGRAFSMEDMKRLKEQVIRYLGALLASISTYLQEEHYLVSSHDCHHTTV